MTDPVFTLERLNWRPCGPGWVHRPGSVVVHAFTGRAEAEAARREAEWEQRHRVNPLRCGLGVVSYQSRFGPERLHDWLLDAGLDPPLTPNPPNPSPPEAGERGEYSRPRRNLTRYQ